MNYVMRTYAQNVRYRHGGNFRTFSEVSAHTRSACEVTS